MGNMGFAGGIRLTAWPKNGVHGGQIALAVPRLRERGPEVVGAIRGELCVAATEAPRCQADANGLGICGEQDAGEEEGDAE